MNVENDLALANLIIAWVSLINFPLLLLIIRMLWGFNNRLTILETQARHDGSKAHYRRYYRHPEEEEKK
jgi:hypothetical protein